ncbi:hypothetical protein GUJ93_ZPchr0001g32216 [Zizania palustris]|uniref:Uncharacterized protein n=1 Tax=Zizania palustris TaxID=103762 RepID=A0A8J5UZI8_ZIZPA|nr:hypothetical protein GUJ93_ZPchr0001g32216 [Zizania palustris]
MRRGFPYARGGVFVAGSSTRRHGRSGILGRSSDHVTKSVPSKRPSGKAQVVGPTFGDRWPLGGTGSLRTRGTSKGSSEEGGALRATRTKCVESYAG